MTASTAADRRGLNLLLLLFIGSGCAALIYEVVWYQSLALIIGSNAVSMAVVLGTYMGGMGLGSLLFLRWRGRFGHPLRIYAQLELVVAVFGLLVLYVLPWAGGLYTAIGGPGFTGVLMRGLFCALFLLLPTMAMGATLPAAASWLRATPEGVSRIGLYYSANILGGVAGCLLSGFYLLRVHDNATASHVAVALNVLVAVAAWLIAGRSTLRTTSDEAASAAANTVVVNDKSLLGGHRAVYIAIGISGACALGAQVVWTRNLALLLGGTVYTFALILAAVLVGLAIGSTLGAVAARNSTQPRRALAICQLLVVFGLGWAAWSITDDMPNWPIDPRLAPSPWYLFQLDFLRCLYAVLPASIAWGAAFPLAIAAVADGSDNSGAAVARVYAANTAGAVLGALLSSLLLIAGIGTQQTQRLMIALALLAVVLLLVIPVRSRAEAARPAYAVPLLVLGVVLTGFAFSIVHKVPGVLAGYGRWSASWLKNHGEFIFIGEGLNSTMAVSQMSDGTRNYHNAGKVQASSMLEDMRLQRMLGHMTTLLARDPKHVLVIGCGAGVTAGAVSISPAVQTETIAEIERLVPQVVSTYFSNENHGVIQNPKVTVRVDDARHFLMTTDRKFDAITADPFDTWVKGAATLNTVEFYQVMKQHLNPGGVVTAWIPFYETTHEAIKSEIATFASVFPHVIIFGNIAGGQGYDGVMVGSMEPISINLSEIAAKLRRPEYLPVLQSLSAVNYGSMHELFGTFAATGAQLKQWLAGAQINRDRNLRLQYLAGLGVNTYDQSGIYSEIQRSGSWPEQVFSGDPEYLEPLRQRVQFWR